MQVSSRRLVDALSDTTGLPPEKIVVVVAGALTLAGTVAVLRVVDLVTRFGTPRRAHS